MYLRVGVHLFRKPNELVRIMKRSESFLELRVFVYSILVRVITMMPELSELVASAMIGQAKKFVADAIR